MSFLSLGFAVFFAAALILYYTLPKKTQPYLLLAASIVFYLFSGPKYIIYLLASTAVTYLCAIAAGRTASDFAARAPKLKKTLPREDYKKASKKAEARGKLFVALALAVDLGILIAVKYLDFIISNAVSLFGGSFPGLGLVLPLGLSYYTFAAVGYIVDVSRGKYPPEKNPFRFALYMTYFPQMLQGPIPRFDVTGPRLAAEHEFDRESFADGLRLILWGCFKMLVIAAAAAPAVSYITENVLVASNAYEVINTPGSGYAGFHEIGGAQLWIGMTAWGIQLYTNFSGGIDIAEGISECFGIKMAENFRRPYFATDLTDYWNRWHISLSEWLKDYVFYPMALSPGFAKFSKFLKKKFGKFIARTLPVSLLSLILFTLVGIWHGANWGEILFGVFNGVIIMVSTLCEPLFVKIRKPLKMDSLLVWRIFRSVRTFILITLTRVISRAPSVGYAMQYYRKMFSSMRFDLLSAQIEKEGGLGKIALSCLPLFIGLAALFTVSLIQERSEGHSVRALLKGRAVLRVALEVLCLAAVAVFGVYGLGYDSSGFIYTQY
jgi:D-alanyl-lipoteichoic acid acyltransferase DltB (MBOAT superfamily)